MISYVDKSSADEFVIFTEVGLVDRLRRDFPEKLFYPASNEAICKQMKRNTLYNSYRALNGRC